MRLLVQIEVQPGKAEEQIIAFRNLAPLVRAEHGCLRYELYRIAGHPERFVFDETWLDHESLEIHDQAEHMIQADVSHQSSRAGPAVATELLLVE